jgi:amino acid transporter
MSINLGSIIAASIGNIAAWIAGSVVAAIAVAVVAAGAVPSGGMSIVVGGILAMGAGGAMGDWASEKVRNADVYLWVRKGFSADTVFKNQDQQERELADKIASAISEGNSDVIAAQVSRRLEAELKELATAAELLVS